MFTNKEEVMLQAMCRYDNPMTIYEVAKKSKISHPTIKKYLQELSARFIVIEVYRNNKTYWSINPEIKTGRQI